MNVHYRIHVDTLHVTCETGRVAMPSVMAARCVRVLPPSE